MIYSVLISTVVALSYNCKYSYFGKISNDHFLYKEDDLAEVKWLEKYEYCRAKGDIKAYTDAGNEKCEFSRGLCYWDYEENTCKNTEREQDTFEVCESLLYDNKLVPGPDNDRLPINVDKMCDAVFMIVF